MAANAPVLRVDGLTMHYLTRQGEVQAVDGVSFDLGRGRVLGLVGESGCGKTSVAMSLMKLLPDNARLTSGRVLLDGQDLLSMEEKELRRYRGRRIAMIFQAAMNSLDPVYRVGDQITEALAAHGLDADRRETRERVAQLFQTVGLEPGLAARYPHEFSGGMRQRAVIAMALVCGPDVLIADEPTIALDVIVQHRILGELKEILANLSMSMIYITHDMGVVGEVADQVGVMYAGRLVEFGATGGLFADPIHPYTAALTAAYPSIYGEKRALISLPGEPPNLIDPPSGCRFHPRCPYATEVCSREEPPVITRGDRWAACWNPLR